MYCEVSSVRRRSRRSASTPPMRVNSMIGSCCRNASSRRKNADPVSDRTIQFCAVAWVHVPTLEVQAPNHCTRKSRLVHAASIRCAARASNVELIEEVEAAGDGGVVASTEDTGSAKSHPGVL